MKLFKLFFLHATFFLNCRPESGHCCIEYTPTTWDVFAGSDSAIGTAVAVDCGLGPGAIAADTLSGTTRCTGED